MTRSTTDDTLNHGNSTYHASVLAGPDDEYAARYSWIAQVWVQDDDRPEVTISAVDDALYTNRILTYPGVVRQVPPLFARFRLERTGDASGRLRINWNTSHIFYEPAPLENRVHLRQDDPLSSVIPPGQSSFETMFSILRTIQPLGRSRTYLLTPPHYCPDQPAECGYAPQYTLGAETEITIPIYSNIMGVGIEADRATIAEGGSVTFTLHRLGGKADALTRPLEVKIAVTQDGDYITGATWIRSPSWRTSPPPP